MIWRNHKRKGNWLLRVTDQTGRRVNISTETKLKTIAEDIDRNVQALVGYSRTNLPLPEHLEKWLASQPGTFISKLVEAGFVGHQRVAAVRPMLEHLTEWRAYLKSCRQTERSRHWIWKANRVEALIKELKIKNLGEIAPSVVQGYVDDLIRRGMATKTAGDYGVDIKSFMAWMVARRYLAFNPLDPLQRPTYKAKRPRRHETPENIQKLVLAAFEGPSIDVHGRDGKDITGIDRGVLYWFAAETGAREIECRCLTVGDFVLDAVQPYVEYRKYNAKGGERSAAKRVQEHPLLNPDLVAMLRVYFAVKAKHHSAFRVPKHLYKAMVQDLERAGIPPKDEDGRIFDFHSFRHSYVTNARRAGVSKDTIREAVGHVSEGILDKHYIHIKLVDKADKLKDVPQYKVPVRIKLTGGGAA